jgi:hypothetical protein
MLLSESAHCITSEVASETPMLYFSQLFFWRSNLLVYWLKRMLNVLFEPKRSFVEAANVAGQRLSEPIFFVAIAMRRILNGERAATPLKAFTLA